MIPYLKRGKKKKKEHTHCLCACANIGVVTMYCFFFIVGSIHQCVYVRVRACVHDTCVLAMRVRVCAQIFPLQALQIMQTEDARCQLILPPSMQLKVRFSLRSPFYCETRNILYSNRVTLYNCGR